MDGVNMNELYAMISEIQQEAQVEEALIKELRSKVAHLVASSEQRRGQLKLVEDHNSVLHDELMAKEASLAQDKHALCSLYEDQLVHSRTMLDEMEANLLFSEQSSASLPPLSTVPWMALTATKCEAASSVSQIFSQVEDVLTRLVEAIPVASYLLLAQHSLEPSASRIVMRPEPPLPPRPPTLPTPAPVLLPTFQAPTNERSELLRAGDGSIAVAWPTLTGQTNAKRLRDESSPLHESLVPLPPLSSVNEALPAIMQKGPPLAAPSFRVRFDQNIGDALHQSVAPPTTTGQKVRKTPFRPSG